MSVVLRAMNPPQALNTNTHKLFLSFMVKANFYRAPEGSKWEMFFGATFAFSRSIFWLYTVRKGVTIDKCITVTLFFLSIVYTDCFPEPCKRAAKRSPHQRKLLSPAKPETSCLESSHHHCYLCASLCYRHYINIYMYISIYILYIIYSCTKPGYPAVAALF